MPQNEALNYVKTKHKEHFKPQCNVMINDDLKYRTLILLQPFDIHLLLKYKFICRNFLGVGMRCDVLHQYLTLRHMVTSYVNHKLLCKILEDKNVISILRGKSTVVKMTSVELFRIRVKCGTFLLV
jgi:hypothetical protein